MEPFDAIVIGAGASGVCCAGELVLAGARPLLISESRDVGYQFRSIQVGDAEAVVQFPTRNLSGEGGWWFSLARKLDVPVVLHRNLEGISVTVEGSGVVTHFPVSVSASALVGIVAAGPSAPQGTDRAELVRVLSLGLVMSAPELAGLHNVSLADWLSNVTGNGVVVEFVLAMGAARTYLPAEQARTYVSVFGLFAPLRNYLCGDAELCVVQPDARRGLFVPMAQAVEDRGGTVWRGRRVAHLLMENDRVVGVVMADGTEARAPVVAMATANARIRTLMDPLPPEVEAVADFEMALGDLWEYSTYSLVKGLDDAYPRRMVITLRPDGSRAQGDWNLGALAPWVARPGMSLMGCEVVCSEVAVAEAGGEEALHARMRAVSDKLHPGYQDGLVAFGSLKHPQIVTQYLTGPKLPQTSPTVTGLWYVGEGAALRDGTHVEGAASAGILGARVIAASLR